MASDDTAFKKYSASIGSTTQAAAPVRAKAVIGGVDSYGASLRAAPTEEGLRASKKDVSVQSKVLSALGKGVSPLTKGVLPTVMQILTMPRNIVVSTTRELVDLMDSDPNTKASFSDFGKQAVDRSYGFGKAFPVEGWKGRFIGFFGDVLLDPWTYATLGGAVPAKAVLKGVLAADGSKILARSVIGKTVAGREGAQKLADFSFKRMNEMVEAGVLKMTSKEIDVAHALIANQGKRALTKDLQFLADDLGLRGPGVYYFGSRVRIPGTGAIGKAAEMGLGNARQFAVGTRVGAAIQKGTTPKGTSRLQNFGPDAIRDMRIGLRNGTLNDVDAPIARAVLHSDDARRLEISSVLNDVETEMGRITHGPDHSEFTGSVRRLLDGRTAKANYDAASPAERALADKWRPLLDQMHDTANVRAESLGGKVNKVENYFPRAHSAQWERETLKKGQEAMDVMSGRPMLNDASRVSSNFRSRDLGPGDEWFGYTIQDTDDLTVDFFNQIAIDSKKVDYNVFETDMTTAMAKYARSFSEQMGLYKQLEDLTANGPGLMARMGQQFGMDPVYREEAIIKGPQKALADAFNSLVNANQAVRGTVNAVRDELGAVRSATIDSIDEITNGLTRQFDAAASTATPFDATELATLEARLLEVDKLLRSKTAGQVSPELTLPGPTLSKGPRRPFRVGKDNAADILVKEKHVAAYAKGSGFLAGRHAEAADQIALGSEFLRRVQTVGGAPTTVDNIFLAQVDAEARFWESAAKLTDTEIRQRFARGVEGMLNTGEMIIDDTGRLINKVTGEIGEPNQIGLVIKDQMNAGWDTLSETFPGMQAVPELKAIWNAVARLDDPIFVRKMQYVFGDALRFHKTYATLSPGFHVRNFVANAFTWLAGDVSIDSMRVGTPLYFKWRTANRNGMKWNDWVKTQSKVHQEALQIAHKAQLGSGGGVFTATFKESKALRGGGKFGAAVENKVTKASQELGQSSDNFSRFVMGFDSGMKGMDVGLATARVRRFYFDYEDLSTVDEYMKQIVPFWIWTTRNLNLHVQNMWLNPRPYAIYNNLKENFRDQYPGYENDFVKENGGFKLPVGEGVFAVPDLGFTRVSEQLGQLKSVGTEGASLAERLGYVNNFAPIFKVPIEQALGRSVYTGKGFDTDKNVFTDSSIEARVLAGLKAFIPTANQYDRLFNTEGGTQRNAWMSYLGSPVKIYKPGG